MHLKTHIAGRSYEELLLLRVACSLVLLLLELHVPVLVLAVLQCVVQRLGVVPSLFCILLAATRSLRSRCMWKLEGILARLIWIGWDRLHV